MRCVAFCTAWNYKLIPLSDYFRSKHWIVKFYKDFLYITRLNTKTDIYFFKHGTFVTWGLTSREEQRLLQQIAAFSVETVEENKIEVGCFIYKIGKKTNIASHERLNVDIITISHEEADNPQIKLAISYGLAQSVKLELHEELIQKTINNNNFIPYELAKKGQILLSRRAISKRIGEIFIERSSVNLNSEYLEAPEYFWEYAHLESYYVMTEQFLDIPKRVAALNSKLDVLHDMFDMLNKQLEYRYSSMLESIIILLIVIEIVVSIIYHF
jgi:uncharacterized Rmd1/YagE family protein